MKLYDDLHGLYPIQKTLRFELKPIGKTMENLEKNKILIKDMHRSEKYEKVKKYCDEYHKAFIERCLSDLSLDGLDDYYDLYKIQHKDEKQIKQLKLIQEKLRKQISNKFKSDKEYKGLNGKELTETYIAEMFKEDPEKLKDIGEFNRFSTYFAGFRQNRENMYTDEEKSTAIAYRLINENLPTFIANIKIFNHIKNEMQDDSIQKAYEELNEYIQTPALEDMFKLDYFNDVLTQRGIDVYNIIISGKSDESGSKIKGLNEYINLYNQKNKTKLPKLSLLYKQILSDSETASFVIEKVENDKELIELISGFYMEFQSIIHSDNKANIINLINNINNYDLEKIYINNDLSLTEISKKVYGEWNTIKDKISEYYDARYIGKNTINTEKYAEEKDRELKKTKVYSLQYLSNIMADNKIIEYIKKYVEENNIIENIDETYENFLEIANKYENLLSKKIVKDEKSIETIKQLLDLIKEFQEFLKIVIPKDNIVEKDENFYSDYKSQYNEILNIIPVYNKTRNYLTQKPYSNEKIKLTFEDGSLLNGWDVTKENTNLGTILLKDNNYYLGIINPKNKKIFEKTHKNSNENKNYRKMEYKQLGGINKQLPRIAFAKARISEFNPSQELIEKYNKGMHKKGDTFDLNFCHELIDFFKKVILTNKDWSMFKIHFSPTDTYNNIADFYSEVEKQLYTINYKEFDEEYINELVNEGKLFLFQIYNKDFSEYSHYKKGKGNPNLHTLYWKELFTYENIKNPLYKLNGGAEMFYRRKSLNLNETAHHPANVEIKNKNIDNKKETSVFNYELIKDKRYTMDKFQLHVPITLNFNNKGIKNPNSIINKFLKENTDNYIIGIDRGERNLIYVSLINSKQEIIYQESFNIIKNTVNGNEYITDYHKLLDNKEKERDEARKSWKTIENIKELKEGYLSQVIHKIITLMEKYNAIVVIEDLNMGFKNSRIKIEKQVYQKFEKMLIDKLNYLVFKNRGKNESGGIRNAYQLSKQFESFNKLGKQTGVLFYIPAWETSKIDPTTGFVNLFYLKNESLEKSREFVNKFEDIRFNKENNYYEFDIDYSKFTDRLNDSKRFWTICSYGKRIRTFRNKKNNDMPDYEEIDVTLELKKLFNKYNIDEDNIKEDILHKSDSKFFNANIDEDGFMGFTYIFKLIIQMRNSSDEKDYIISPVKNNTGKFFDSNDEKEKNDNGEKAELPIDADANGAYNIARKGLMLINQIKETSDEDILNNKVKFNITNKEWLKFAQGDK